MEKESAGERIANPLLKKYLEDFYTDLILVERDALLTAQTYEFSAAEFLKWIELQKIELGEINTQSLLYYLVWRKTNG